MGENTEKKERAEETRGVAVAVREIHSDCRRLPESVSWCVDAPSGIRLKNTVAENHLPSARTAPEAPVASFGIWHPTGITTPGERPRAQCTRNYQNGQDH